MRTTTLGPGRLNCGCGLLCDQCGPANMGLFPVWEGPLQINAQRRRCGKLSIFFRASDFWAAVIVDGYSFTSNSQRVKMPSHVLTSTCRAALPRGCLAPICCPLWFFKRSACSSLKCQSLHAYMPLCLLVSASSDRWYHTVVFPVLTSRLTPPSLCSSVSFGVASCDRICSPQRGFSRQPSVVFYAHPKAETVPRSSVQTPARAWCCHIRMPGWHSLRWWHADW